MRRRRTLLKGAEEGERQAVAGEEGPGEQQHRDPKSKNENKNTLGRRQLSRKKQKSGQSCKKIPEIFPLPKSFSQFQINYVSFSFLFRVSCGALHDIDPLVVPHKIIF